MSHLIAETPKEQAIIDHFKVSLKQLEEANDELTLLSNSTEKELYEAIDDLEKQKEDLEKKLEKALMHSQPGAKESLSKDINKLHSELEKMTTRCQELERTKVLFEQTNEELLNTQRISEATEDDLRSKLEMSLEENVFLQQDIDEKMDDIKRLKFELTELQSEVAAKDDGEGNTGEFSPQKTGFSTGDKINMTMKELTQKSKDDSDLIEALEIEVKEINEKLVASDQLNAELNDELEKMIEEVTLKDEQMNELKKSQMLELSSFHLESTQIKQKLEEQIVRLSAELNRIEGESELASINSKETDLNFQISDLHSQLYNLTNASQTKDEELVTKEDVITKLTQSVHDMLSAMDAKDEEIRSRDNAAVMKELQLTSLTSEHMQLSAKLEESKLEIVSLQNDVQSRKSNEIQLVSDLTVLRTTSDEYVTSIACKDSDLESLRAQLAEYEKTNQNYANEIHNLRTQHEKDIEVHKGNRSEQLKGVENDLVKLQAAYDEIVGQYGALQGEHQALTVTHTTTKDKLLLDTERLKMELIQVHRQHTEEKERWDMQQQVLHQDKQDADKAIHILQEKIKCAAHEAELKAKLQEHHREIDHLRNDFEDKLTEKQKTLKIMEEQISSLTNEKNELFEQSKMVSDELLKLKGELIDRQQALEVASMNRDTMKSKSDSEFSELQNKYLELEQKFKASEAVLSTNMVSIRDFEKKIKELVSSNNALEERVALNASLTGTKEENLEKHIIALQSMLKTKDSELLQKEQMIFTKEQEFVTAQTELKTLHDELKKQLKSMEDDLQLKDASMASNNLLIADLHAKEIIKLEEKLISQIEAYDLKNQEMMKREVELTREREKRETEMSLLVVELKSNLDGLTSALEGKDVIILSQADEIKHMDSKLSSLKCKHEDVVGALSTNLEDKEILLAFQLKESKLKDDEILELHAQLSDVKNQIDGFSSRTTIDNTLERVEAEKKLNEFANLLEIEVANSAKLQIDLDSLLKTHDDHISMSHEKDLQIIDLNHKIQMLLDSSRTSAKSDSDFALKISELEEKLRKTDTLVAAGTLNNTVTSELVEHKDLIPNESFDKSENSLLKGQLPSEDFDKELQRITAAYELRITQLNSEIDEIKQAALTMSTQMLRSKQQDEINTVEANDSTNDPEVLKQQLIQSQHRIYSLQCNNAQLLQRLQSSRSNIQVCCRTRPINITEASQGGKICVNVVDENELLCFDRRANEWKSFVFDKCWEKTAPQEEVFVDIEPLALSVVDGYNVSIIAYGQTGSGKTYTMDSISHKTLQKMFQLLEHKRFQAKYGTSKATITLSPGKINTSSLTSIESMADDTSDIIQSEYSFSITVSMMEIYNEQVKDLLVTDSSVAANLDVRLSPEGEVFVPGLSKHKVSTVKDVFALFDRGSSNRATAATNLNEHSSRSHSILVIEVASSLSDDSPPLLGKLYLIDLAGSEKVSKSGVTGTAMKEAQNINRSLSALGDVMEALDSKAKHVPYRNSALTFLLQNSLGGRSRTMMVVTLCPTDLSSEETLFTLQFAQRVRNIQLGTARKNVNTSIKNLEDQLGRLKSELKDNKRKRLTLEETILGLKRDKKKDTEKSSYQSDNKIRQYEEARKTAESIIQQLQKANADFTVKLQREREGKATTQMESEALRKTTKKLQDQLSNIMKEKEELQFTVNTLKKDGLKSLSRGGRILSTHNLSGPRATIELEPELAQGEENEKPEETSLDNAKVIDNVSDHSETTKETRSRLPLRGSSIAFDRKSTGPNRSSVSLASNLPLPSTKAPVPIFTRSRDSSPAPLLQREKQDEIVQSTSKLPRREPVVTQSSTGAARVSVRTAPSKSMSALTQIEVSTADPTSITNRTQEALQRHKDRMLKKQHDQEQM